MSCILYPVHHLGSCFGLLFPVSLGLLLWVIVPCLVQSGSLQLVEMPSLHASEEAYAALSEAVAAAGAEEGSADRLGAALVTLPSHAVVP